MKGFVKYLTNERGVLYEIPLMLLAYGVLCAVAIPWLHRSVTVHPALLLIPFLLIGLGVACFLGRAISIPRVYLLGAPSCFWVFILLSCLTLPLMSICFAPWSNTAMLLGQTYLSFRADLWFAEKEYHKKKEETP